MIAAVAASAFAVEKRRNGKRVFKKKKKKKKIPWCVMHSTTLVSSWEAKKK